MAGRQLEKDVVAGKRHLLPINLRGEHGMEFRLTGSVVDLELVLLPREPLAVAKLAFDRNRTRQGARRAAPAGGILQHLRHLVERPDARALVPHEMGNAHRVIVVDMGDQNQIDVMHAVHLPQLVEVVDDEAHGVAVLTLLGDAHVRRERVPVIDEARLAALREQDVEVGAGLWSAP